MANGPAFPEVQAAAKANAGWAFERLYQSLGPAVAGYARAQGAEEPEEFRQQHGRRFLTPPRSAAVPAFYELDFSPDGAWLVASGAPDAADRYPRRRIYL